MSPTPAAFLWIALLVLLLVGGLAFVLGRQTVLMRQAAQLRQARAEARCAERLRRDWRWRSNAEHRLVLWQPPAGSAFDTPPAPPPPTPAPLAERLAAEQPFQDFEVQVPAGDEPHRGWRLAGEPLADDEGRFAGFEGRAAPVDEAAVRARDAAALATAFDALEGPALLLVAEQGNWSVARRNGNATRRWATLVPGAAFAAQAQELPPALGAVLRQSVTPGAVVRAEGWSLAPVADSPPTVLLWHAGTGGDAGLADNDSFSFTLSHDLRAPIRVVEGFTRIVKEDYGGQLDRVGNDHLDRVLGAAARMNLMIDALLGLARLSQQPLARQRVDLSQLAGYVVDEQRRAAPDRPVEAEIEPGLAAVGDPTLLRLVLENLIGNAWKYTARIDAARVWIGRVPHGDGQAFCVRDNGAGFDPRSAERLFGLFQRLHSASDFPGHGVGLASVRRIVQRHGGEVWAESEPGRGAAFYFTLAV